MSTKPHSPFIALFVMGLVAGCSDPEGNGWPIEEPPRPPSHLQSRSDLRPKAGLPMAPVKPSFNWPDHLRLAAVTTIEQRADSQLWRERRATTRYASTVTVTPTSVGPIITLGDFELQENTGSDILSREAGREAALAGQLAFRVRNDGQFNRVEDPDATIAAVTKTLAARRVDAPEIKEPLPEVTAAEVEERAKAVWSAWIENALGLVGSPTAGWCGQTQPPTMFVETDRPATACLVLSAGSQCLVDGTIGSCFLVEYGLELTAAGDEKPELGEAVAPPEPAAPAAVRDPAVPAPPEVRHETRARVMLEMPSLLPVKVEVWRFTDVTETIDGGQTARTWKTRYSLTRFRRIEGPPVGAARAKLQASCEKGSAEDCVELGVLIGTGKDGATDLREARAWVEKACRMEPPQGCELLEVMVDVQPKEPPAGPVVP